MLERRTWDPPVVGEDKECPKVSDVDPLRVLLVSNRGHDVDLDIRKVEAHGPALDCNRAPWVSVPNGSGERLEDHSRLRPCVEARNLPGRWIDDEDDVDIVLGPERRVAG